MQYTHVYKQNSVLQFIDLTAIYILFLLCIFALNCIYALDNFIQTNKQTFFLIDACIIHRLYA